MDADPDFLPDSDGLVRAIQLLIETDAQPFAELPNEFPSAGLGSAAALELLAPYIIGGAGRLDRPEVMAHMDPPTPWVTWATAMWNARLNQNLLHPSTAPFARQAERLVIEWLSPWFGMSGGHMTAGSTLANLTALWAARDVAGARRVVTSSASHLSVKKAARILGMDYAEIPADDCQRMTSNAVGGLAEACLVLTAGTTAAGAVDDLSLAGTAAWTHIDAAWAGPLRLSDRYAQRLAGIERADSVAISGHKWLFQPKGSGVILFRDVERANEALSFGGNYLAAANIGILGSHGAIGVTLLATLLAVGQSGIARRIDDCMAKADQLWEVLERHHAYRTFARPQTGIVLFAPVSADPMELAAALPAGLASLASVRGEAWLRCVAANPLADIDLIVDHLDQAARDG